MNEIYPYEETQRLKKRARRLTWFARAVAVAALIVCIVCCVRCNTLEALMLQWTAVFTSAAAGWIIILLYGMVLSPLNALLRHAEGLRKGPSESFAGVMTLRSDAFRIPHSVTVRKVQLDGEEPVTLNIAADKAHLLPPNGTAIRVTAVRKYITAWEVQHADD